MDNKKTTEKTPKSTADRVLTAVGIVLCVVFIPILVINCTLIIKSYVNKDEVPSFFSISPMIVQSGSMEPTIKTGDLIFVAKIDTAKLAEGDIISYFDPASKSQSVVTHRITKVVNDAKGLSFIVKGDANNAEDKDPIPAGNVVGIYKFRIPGLGDVAMFMQTTAGLIVCIAVPVILLVGYDLIRRRNYDKEKKKDTDALLEELELLRKQAAEKENSAEKNDENENKTE